MNDFIGKELNVGDAVVARVAKNWHGGPGLQAGIIKKINKVTAVVSFSVGNRKHERQIRSNDLIAVDLDYFVAHVLTNSG